MKYDLFKCEIIKKQETAKGVFDFTVENTELSQIAKPGQFVNILVPGKTLRRPISICEINPDEKILRIVFEVRGEGTRILSDFEVGEYFDFLAPLGNGWDIKKVEKKVLLVGGGIGVPPIVELAKKYGEKSTAIIGFRTAQAIILKETLISTGAKVLIATDDGTEGHHGFVTDIIKKELETVEYDIVYACGPNPMLKAVAMMTEEKQIETQVSQEERMGCGIGACLVCACKTKNADGTETYSHVCKKGPVFDSKEVVW